MSATFAPLQKITDPAIAAAGVELLLLRLDQYSPQPGGYQGAGNKYFKLKYNLAQAHKLGRSQLLSFGGAYSNHLHALALIGREHGFATVGLVRGEKVLPFNACLQDVVDAGMALRFVSREQYRQRHEPAFLARLQCQYPDSYIIPEGGSNILGVRGCMDIVAHIRHHLGNDFDQVLLPAATGSTLAGIAAGLAEGGSGPRKQQAVGICVLKRGEYIAEEVQRYLLALGVDANANWQLLHDHHGGGYAKITASLVAFITAFKNANGVQLEPVYSAKMLYGLYQMLDEGRIARGSRIVAIHTGGLQGLRGMTQRMQRLANA